MDDARRDLFVRRTARSASMRGARARMSFAVSQRDVVIPLVVPSDRDLLPTSSNANRIKRQSGRGRPPA